MRGRPHSGRREHETVRHLWGARNELGTPRVLRSSTSNLDDPSDSGGQHGRSARNPPYGASSGWWVILPWRLGDVHVPLCTWAPSWHSCPECLRHHGRCRPGCLALGRRTACDPHARAGSSNTHRPLSAAQHVRRNVSRNVDSGAEQTVQIRAAGEFVEILQDQLRCDKFRVDNPKYQESQTSVASQRRGRERQFEEGTMTRNGTKKTVRTRTAQA